jgi:hypothetical protein
LTQVRRDANQLWDRVKTLNSEPEPTGAKRVRVTFYFGQNVEEEFDA